MTVGPRIADAATLDLGGIVPASADYEGFIARRRPRRLLDGIEPPGDLCPHLFPHQRDCLEFSLRVGRAGAFLWTGLGKSLVALEWARIVARHTGKPALILTPLAVAAQFVREGERFGIEARQVREAHEVGPGINVANYERLDRFAAIDFGGVVLDECFAPGTLIDAVADDGSVIRKSIEKIRVGDAILNASGVDTVSDIHRREVPYAVRIKVSGSFCLCSPNHPFFTQRGWVGAQDLIPGDRALVTEAAMRLVRDGILSKASGSAQTAVLRDILLSEMADEPARAPCEGSCSRSSGEARREGGSLAQVRDAGSRGPIGSIPHASANAGIHSEDVPYIATDRAQTFRAWGQWDWANGSSDIHEGCSWRRLDSGICFVVGPTDSRLSNALQDRLGQSRAENRHRSGWFLPQVEEGAGQEEGGEASFARVDGIEVLELGHPELERYRDADGKLYFYDLGGSRHPSFSVNGVLVHNSGILKSFAGRTKQALIERFKHTPFRLSCTATPAPNDHMELGNQAEFLGVMPANEMLARWFINDTMHFGSYRLKKHAVQNFWDWVCSWASCVSSPSDLGHDDGPFRLPALVEKVHRVSSDITAGAGGALFRLSGISATNMHKEQRLSLPERVGRMAELAKAEPGEPWLIWCNTDEQADALAAALPEAVEVRGSHPAEWKEDRLLAFADGRARILITKPRIAGWGLNFQRCARMGFVALDFSYEAYFQAIRRCWRFGQKRPVHVHLISSDGEAEIFAAVRRKAEQHEEMRKGMREAVRRAQARSDEVRLSYSSPHAAPLPSWVMELPQ